MGTSADSLNSRRGYSSFSFSSLSLSLSSVNVPPSLFLSLSPSLSPLPLFPSLSSDLEVDESDSGTAEVGQLICAHRPSPRTRSTEYLQVHIRLFGFHRQTTLNPMRVPRHRIFRITD